MPRMPPSFSLFSWIPCIFVRARERRRRFHRGGPGPVQLDQVPVMIDSGFGAFANERKVTSFAEH